MTWTAPEPLMVGKSAVDRFAQDLASKLSFDPGADIELLVTRLGGRITVDANSVDDVDGGSIVASSLRDFRISISPYTSLVRDRFTIAHELGHLFLHFPKMKERLPNATMRATRWIDKSDRNQQRAEWEANWFAAGFIMPRDKFAEAFKTSSPEQLAKMFKVSLSAANVRIISLGLH